MSDKFSCDKCGKEFDSERGLHVHQSQVHAGEHSDNTSEDTTESDEPMEAVFQFKSRKTLYTSFLIGVLVGGFLIGGLNALNSQGTALPGNNTDSSSDRIQFSSGNFSDDPTLGAADAPVRVVMVTDYGCPWCAEWMGFNAIPDDAARADGTIDKNENYRKIQENYIDTGEVKLTVMDYPAHTNALQAHKSANCIRQQNESLYNDFSKSLYDRRSEWLGGQSGQDMPDQTFRSIAQNIGANSTALAQCVPSTDDSEIQDDVNLVSSKVDRIGTPLFFIGNEENGFVKIRGAQSYETMSKIIDQELQK